MYQSKLYTDGTRASGEAPLPAMSPEQQDAAYPAGRTPGQHDSDCSTNNRGVPDLLGPCDCSLSIEQGFQKFLLRNGYANLSVEEAEELRAAYQHGASGHAIAPCVPLPAPDVSGNIYGLPQALFTEPKGLRSAFQDHAKYLAAQAQAKGEMNLLEGRIFEKAQQLGLV